MTKKKLFYCSMGAGYEYNNTIELDRKSKEEILYILKKDPKVNSNSLKKISEIEGLNVSVWGASRKSLENEVKSSEESIVLFVNQKQNVNQVVYVASIVDVIINKELGEALWGKNSPWSYQIILENVYKTAIPMENFWSILGNPTKKYNIQQFIMAKDPNVVKNFENLILKYSTINQVLKKL